MTRDVETYLSSGCGRCELGGTLQCKVHQWPEELRELRRIILDCGLREESKWGVPCYTFEGKNVLMLSAFREHCSINFFKGSLLSNERGLLSKPGVNSQAARFMKFTDVQTVIRQEPEIRASIFEAIEVEKAGLKVAFRKNPEPVPEELEARFREDPLLKEAFESLTPGRQRGYILFFSSPKKSETKDSRIRKSIGKILRGEGMHDGYRKRKG